MRIFNKISSIVLALCMAISLFAVPAYATTPVDVKDAVQIEGRITDLEDDFLNVYLVIPQGIEEIRGAQFKVAMPAGITITDVAAAGALQGWECWYEGNGIILECGQGFNSVQECYPGQALNYFHIATLTVDTDEATAGEEGDKTVTITVEDITSGEGDGKNIYANLNDASVDYTISYDLCSHIGGEATCMAKPVCDECGKTYGAVNPDAHKYTDYKYNNDATCIADGNETAQCDNGCGVPDVRVKEDTALGHTGGTANCTDLAKCTRCSAPYGELNPNNHKAPKTTLIPAKAATCTATGLTAGYKCVCGVVTVAQTTVKAKGHTYGADYVSVKATTSKDGAISDKCSCGAVRKVLTIYRAKTVKLSKTSVTYNGKSQKPSVTVKDSKGKTISKSYYSVKYSNNKKVGKATVKVTFKGRYSGSKTLTFKINPKKTSISSLKAGKKAFTVKYKKQTSGSGYEIQYSTSKKFKSAKTVKIKSNKTVSKTVKKLKAKKTYYVRVRTVKGSYKSAWTSAKKVKTK